MALAICVLHIGFCWKSKILHLSCEQFRDPRGWDAHEGRGHSSTLF